MNPVNSGNVATSTITNNTPLDRAANREQQILSRLQDRYTRIQARVDQKPGTSDYFRNLLANLINQITNPGSTPTPNTGTGPTTPRASAREQRITDKLLSQLDNIQARREQNPNTSSQFSNQLSSLKNTITPTPTTPTPTTPTPTTPTPTTPTPPADAVAKYGQLTFIKISPATSPTGSSEAWLISATASPMLVPVEDANGEPVILSDGRPLFQGSGGDGGIGNQ